VLAYEKKMRKLKEIDVYTLMENIANQISRTL